jgi:hypothetical protein
LELNGVVRVIVGGFFLAAANYIMATMLVATTQRNYMNDKTKPYGITKHRLDGYFYFPTSYQEHQQFLEMALGDIQPEQCKWTIQPLKYNPKGYDPQIMGTGNHLFVVTSQHEWEQVMMVAGGQLKIENAVFTIPPLPWTAS